MTDELLNHLESHCSRSSLRRLSRSMTSSQDRPHLFCAHQLLADNFLAIATRLDEAKVLGECCVQKMRGSPPRGRRCQSEW